MFPAARISDVLTSLARSVGDHVTVSDIVAVLRDRAFALLVVLLGLPNCLPMPPPIPLVCGLLLALVAAQICAGWSSPWLPRVLLRRSIRHGDITRAVDRALPTIRRLERFSRPRMAFLESPLAFRLIGVLLLVLSLGLLVAAPIVGQIPLGFAVCLIGLGLVERDGVFVLGGLLVGIFGLTLSLGFVYAVVSGLEHLL